MLISTFIVLDTVSVIMFLVSSVLLFYVAVNCLVSREQINGNGDRVGYDAVADNTGLSLFV